MTTVDLESVVSGVLESVTAVSAVSAGGTSTCDTSRTTADREPAEQNRQSCSVRLSAFTLKNDGHLASIEPVAAVVTECGHHSARVTFEWDAMPDYPSVVFGVPTVDGESRFAAGILTSHEVRDDGIHCELIRGGIGERILAEEARVPSLGLEFFQYQLPHAISVYESWSHAGILTRTVLDRVLVCGKCQSVATFRFACRQCGSGRVGHQMLAHHFACGIVAPLNEFETGDSLSCPNCRTKHLVAGTDFEYMPGENECGICGWSDRDLEQTGHCLNCDSRFAAHKAVEQELVGYHVERMASLADIANLG